MENTISEIMIIDMIMHLKIIVPFTFKLYTNIESLLSNILLVKMYAFFAFICEKFAKTLYLFSDL